jgi:hypothetical protein
MKPVRPRASRSSALRRLAMREGLAASLLRPATDPGLITDKYAEMTDAELLDKLVATIESLSPDIRISRDKQSGLSVVAKKGQLPVAMRAALVPASNRSVCRNSWFDRMILCYGSPV